MIDWSASAAWIALVVAIIAPVLTTIINNRHQEKMKEHELFEARKLDAIENYLRYAGKASYQIGVPEEFAFYKATIYLYASPAIHDKISKLNKLIEDTNFSDETAQLLSEVAIDLRHENKVG